MTNQPPKPQSTTAAPPSKPLSTTASDMHAFVASRDRAYDDAWLKSSQVQKFLDLEHTAIWQTPYSFAWQMIMNKLIRAMASPENADHWKDIQGYCELVLEDQAKTR